VKSLYIQEHLLLQCQYEIEDEKEEK